MTVEQYLNHNGIDNFRIVSFVNWQTEILYDSRTTKKDLPNYIYDSIIENVYDSNSNLIDIEI